jgi:hypothetical protein
VVAVPRGQAQGAHAPHHPHVVTVIRPVLGLVTHCTWNEVKVKVKKNIKYLGHLCLLYSFHHSEKKSFIFTIC